MGGGWFVVAGEHQSRVRCSLGLGLIKSELSRSMGGCLLYGKVSCNLAVRCGESIER